ncbi:MAG: T9SS type A sorting domain-containing protein [Saprospiraceae bacterium]|nr:T9SS type A sorting domain-containing protein [Saprospiraceae bacterium]
MAVLDFNEDPVKIPETGQTFPLRENSASISNEYGQLLFYTNGCEIRGADYQLIENGDSLNPGFQTDLQCSGGNIGPQGSLFLPAPSYQDLYYLIHLNFDWIPPHYSVGHWLYYSLVDQSIGTGKVLDKNHLLLQDTFTVGLITACKHANGRDWWIVIPEMASNKLYRFLLDPRGIQGPWEQRIGTVDQDDSHTGQVVFSPDGRYYARMDDYNKLHIYDFDRCTGLFSNPRFVDIPDSGLTYGVPSSVAFSPNSQLLYAGQIENLYQINMLVSSIEASLLLVGELDDFEAPFYGYFQKMQLAPDGKIYLSTGSKPYLNVIDNPNEKGVACHFIQHEFLLPDQNYIGLPNMSNYRLGRLEGSPCDSLYLAPEYPTCLENQLEVFPNPFQKELHIRFNDCLPGLFDFVLYDVLGRVVWRASFEGGSFEYPLILPDLPANVYLYQITQYGEKLKSGKLVKR